LFTSCGGSGGVGKITGRTISNTWLIGGGGGWARRGGGAADDDRLTKRRRSLVEKNKKEETTKYGIYSTTVLFGKEEPTIY
jgi:hypothetical protein